MLYAEKKESTGKPRNFIIPYNTVHFMYTVVYAFKQESLKIFNIVFQVDNKIFDSPFKNGMEKSMEGQTRKTRLKILFSA